jgi:hypothetical protein
VTELRVGLLGYAVFKAHTVAMARGLDGLAADGPRVWFADSEAVGRALVTGMMAEVAGGPWRRLVVEMSV